ncbi:hypothetical protein [uncultured Phascolarctobacterium sp.]|jgi:hypothetical protein|uniref:Uncharacterized protein n=1 Tax=Caudovirales sp. ctIZM3 TaxID=2827633 RepID=A0A8S5T8X0_9CAUD|nr:hypothetical protein [uncultured Phascolarctobacterium sp.]DAF59467.1 MAG TPA: hypothetical protein [Caudovirales sp. ctIZM3]
MLEILAYMTKVLTDLLFWMEEKEQDAAIRRIATINKVIHTYVKSIKRLEEEKEEVEKKYFIEEE